MIVVNISNGMETELTTNESSASENVKYFKHYCYGKLCNILFRNNVTKEYVTSLTMPYFECTYLEVKGQGFAELHFERYVEKKEPVKTEEAPASEVETNGSTDKEAFVESVNKAIDSLPDVEEPAEEKKEETPAPVKRGRGRPKKSA